MGDTPKDSWMVYFMENPIYKWMIWGYPYILICGYNEIYWTYLACCQEMSEPNWNIIGVQWQYHRMYNQ